MSDIRRRARKRLTDADFRKAAQEQIAELNALAMFADTDTTSSADRITRCAADPEFFKRTYLPHYFADAPADFHAELARDLTARNQLTAITAFRGGAKSTQVFGQVLYECCMNSVIDAFKFLVYVLDSHDKAMMYTQRILLELQHNERIKTDFGMRVSKEASMGDFIIFDPVSKKRLARIVAFGAGMSMRGLVNEETRPDWIICEDLQDRESAESEKRTKKLLRIVLGDNRGALVPTGYRMTIIGNIICSGSMMDQLLDPKKHPSFVKRNYPALITDSEGIRRSTWQSRFPLHLLDQMRIDMGDVLFLAEMMCQPVEQDGYFSERRDIHHWKELPRQIDLTGCIMQVDPSFSAHGDCTAIGVAVRYEHHAERSDFTTWCDDEGNIFGAGIYDIFIEIYNRQNTIDEFLQKLFELYQKYLPLKIYIDGSVEQEIVFGRFIGEYELRSKISLPIVWQDFTESKDLRIRGVQPYMQRRRVLLPPRSSEDVSATVLQFLRYGKSAVPDDGPDMIAAAVENLGSGSVESTVEVWE